MNLVYILLALLAASVIGHIVEWRAYKKREQKRLDDNLLKLAECARQSERDKRIKVTFAPTLPASPPVHAPDAEPAPAPKTKTETKNHETGEKEMTSDAAQRKATPIATGVLDYFPDAIAEVSRASLAGNKQHMPGQPLHWDRSKSSDESDALIRHFMDRGKIDSDGVRHSAKVAWRALALLQKEIEAATPPQPEYILSEPPQDQSDWKNWCGGEMPVDADTLVDVRRRDGGLINTHARNVRWNHYDTVGDIVSYRILKKMTSSAPHNKYTPTRWPDWANWWAYEPDGHGFGSGYFFETQPEPSDSRWIPTSPRFMFDSNSLTLNPVDWRTSLVRKPE